MSESDANMWPSFRLATGTEPAERETSETLAVKDVLYADARTLSVPPRPNTPPSTSLSHD